MSSLSDAFESLLNYPFRERNVVYGFARGGYMFVRGVIGAVTGSIGGILESLRRGLSVILASN